MKYGGMDIRGKVCTDYYINAIRNHWGDSQSTRPRKHACSQNTPFPNNLWSTDGKCFCLCGSDGYCDSIWLIVARVKGPSINSCTICMQGKQMFIWGRLNMHIRLGKCNPKRGVFAITMTQSKVVWWTSFPEWEQKLPKWYLLSKSESSIEIRVSTKKMTLATSRTDNWWRTDKQRC